MRIFHFGATGGTGKEVLTKLLTEKHQVVVLARNPIVLEELKKLHDNLEIVKGSIYSLATYQKELHQCDLVISTLGTGT